MNLIEKLGLEKCKAIVGEAPDDSASHCVFNDGIYFSLEFATVWNGSWLKCNHRNIRSWEYEYGEDEIINLDDLRTAIANHGTPTNEGTDNLSHFDHCGDIANHISPNTKVIER